MRRMQSTLVPAASAGEFELFAAVVPRYKRHVLAEGEFERTLERIAARELDPYTAVDRIVARAVRRCC